LWSKGFLLGKESESFFEWTLSFPIGERKQEGREEATSLLASYGLRTNVKGKIIGKKEQ